MTDQDGERAAGGTPFWLLVAGVAGLCYFAQPLDLFYSVAPMASVDTHVRAVEQGSVTRQLALLLAGLWAGVWLLAYRPRLRLDGRLAGLALAFLLVVAASIGWAHDPLLSAKRAGTLLVFATCCLALALQIGVARLASFVCWCGAIVVVTSVGAELALGTFSPLEPDYRFAGLMHPNEQGIYCGCLVLAGASLASRGRRGAAACGVLTGIGLLLLLLTKSRISLASTIAGLVFYAALTSARARYWLLLASTAGAIASVPLIFLGPRGLAPFLTVLGMGRPQDASMVLTLTGRTELWRVLLQYVAERPLLGYGYGGFWTPPRLVALTQHEGWALGSAHSQYIEVLLQVGVFGLAAFCAIGVVALSTLVRRHWSRGDDGFAVAAGLFVLVAVSMFVESRPLDPSLPMVTCVMIVAGLAVSRGARGEAGWN